MLIEIIITTSLTTQTPQQTSIAVPIDLTFPDGHAIESITISTTSSSTVYVQGLEIEACVEYIREFYDL